LNLNLLLSVKLTSGVSGYNSDAFTKYPQGFDYTPLSIIDVFCTAVASYSKLEFKHAYVLIDPEGLDSPTLIHLEYIINNNINASFLHIQFSRPCTKFDWLHLIKTIDDSLPYLVCMNHDMICNTNNNELGELTERLNTSLMKNNTLLAYTHIPEMVAWACHNIKGYNFSYDDNFWTCKKNNRFWVDGIFIMSNSTLYNIFYSIRGTGPEYLPRFDWPNVFFDKITLNTIVLPINLFSHYDGSTHLICSKLLEHFRILIGNSNDNNILLFKEFIEVYYITFALWFTIPRFHNFKFFSTFLMDCLTKFIKAKTFCKSDLDKTDYDRLVGLIKFYQAIIYDYSKSDAEHIKLPLKSRISYLFNSLAKQYTV
jgi:frataxin-like iron-binding protein CyaY